MQTRRTFSCQRSTRTHVWPLQDAWASLAKKAVWVLLNPARRWLPCRHNAWRRFLFTASTLSTPEEPQPAGADLEIHPPAGAMRHRQIIGQMFDHEDQPQQLPPLLQQGAERRALAVGHLGVQWQLSYLPLQQAAEHRHPAAATHLVDQLQQLYLLLQQAAAYRLLEATSVHRPPPQLNLWQGHAETWPHHCRRRRRRRRGQTRLLSAGP